MGRTTIDDEGLDGEFVRSIRAAEKASNAAFEITRIGHVVLRVADLSRSVAFYTELLGFKVTDVYPDTMMPGGMVFMRCNRDHHGVALIGGSDGQANAREMHHMAFEVATLDEVIRARDLLVSKRVPITYEGRRRAGCQIAVEFEDPDGHALEVYWGLDQIGDDGRSRPADEWLPRDSLASAIEEAPVGQEIKLLDGTLKP